MQRVVHNRNEQSGPPDEPIDRALVELNYLFHDLATIDPLAQYFVAMARSVLEDRRSGQPARSEDVLRPH